MKQWNPEAKHFSELPEEHKHEAVRGTSYMEVHKLIGTAGCSNDGKMWVWSVLGVLETKRGKLVVYPGDWIGKLNNAEYFIVPKLEEGRFLMEMDKDDLVTMIVGYQLSYKQETLPAVNAKLSVNNNHVLAWDRSLLGMTSLSELIEIRELLWSTE